MCARRTGKVLSHRVITSARRRLTMKARETRVTVGADATLTRELILSRLREAKPSLQAEFPLKRLALFGSYALGTEITGTSDIDILVEVDPSIGLGFVTLAERLEQILGEQVDLVSRRAIKPSLWRR